MHLRKLAFLPIIVALGGAIEDLKVREKIKKKKHTNGFV
jgi:hypothetical protein